MGRRAEFAGWCCLALLVAAFLVAGTIGHDPWKPDEAYTFGVVFHILQGGDWVVPTLGGEPFMEKPPLYYLAAAASATLFSPVLALHDGPASRARSSCWARSQSSRCPRGGSSARRTVRAPRCCSWDASAS
jgi:hypothetical protein